MTDIISLETVADILKTEIDADIATYRKNHPYMVAYLELKKLIQSKKNAIAGAKGAAVTNAKVARAIEPSERAALEEDEEPKQSDFRAQLRAEISHFPLNTSDIGPETKTADIEENLPEKIARYKRDGKTIAEILPLFSKDNWPIVRKVFGRV